MRAAHESPAIVAGHGLPTFLWLLLLLLLSSSGFAQGTLRPGTGEFLLTDASGHVQTALHRSSDVTMTISGMTARVNLRQTFTNDTAQWQQGTYLFPLPEDSAVNAMRMVVGTREIIGEVREREEAQRAYDQARSEGRKAALVEQQRPNLFTQKLANIAPGETLSIDLQYVQALRYDSGRFTLRFPLTLTPRHGSGIEAGSNTVSVTIALDAGVALGSVGSTTHALDVFPVPGRPGRFEMELRAGRAPMDRDFELAWTPVTAAAPQAAVFTDVRADATYLQLMLLPPQVEQPVTPLGREVIIVLDSSGSMDGSSIVQAKQGVQLALSGLRSGDWFNIIDFDSAFQPLFPQSQPASRANLQRAQDFVASLAADGGTEMYPALQYALAQPPAVAAGQDLLRQVVFVTDGAVGNEDALFALIAARLGAARLFTVGIGAAPNSYFMRKAAELGRGTYTYIDRPERVADSIGTLLRKLENAVMTDLAVEWPAGVSAESYPEHIPDLYLGEPLFVTARLTGRVPAQHTVLVSGTLDGRPWQQSVAVDAAQRASTAELPVNMSSLASYWARQKIDALLNTAFSGNHSDAAAKAALRQQVLAVALPFQLLSPYTSFIAEEKRVSGPANEPFDASAAPKAVPGAQLQQLQYPATATPAAAWLLAASLCLLCAALSLLSLRTEKEVAGA